MRTSFFTLLAVCFTLAVLGIASTASAKKVAVPKMYMFGFAASFTDSIVHFTDIQEVDSAWIDTKSKFLLSREEYSYQLRDYLNEQQQMPHRTCVVVYNQNKAKLQKKLAKMLKLYTNPKKGAQQFDVRRLEDGAFHFRAIDMSYYADEENEQ
ncbi:MAG: hypothetical protein IJ612_03700 [Prevotella sp.]|nr:hypothetical protein [Prevotella sp.]